MTRTTRYALASSVLVGVVLAVLLPVFEGRARLGATVGALLALMVQIPAFTVLVRGWNRPDRVFAFWFAGSVLRVAAVAAGVALVVFWSLPPAETLLPLAGLLFVMLLMEPLFVRRDAGSPTW